MISSGPSILSTMLSKRDKLLVQPWEQRRFEDHRAKVTSALPAIDARCPPARPHVTLKLKQLRRELDRKAKIQSDNFFMLQRLRDIMKVNRLDNRWSKPLPNFNHKVGQFFDVDSLNNKMAFQTIRLSPDESYYTPVKCYACEHKMQTKRRDGAQESLPSIQLKLH